jgi:lysozyme
MAKRKRKKKKRIPLPMLILSALVITGLVWGFIWWTSPKSGFVKYEEFGISIPENFLIHGIDVSRYQQTIAWDAVKEMQEKKIKIGFAFIKATEGINNIDPQFRRNWRRSKREGMIRGAYHFFIASKDGRLQAENFIKHVDLEKNDLPPVVDIEQMYGTSSSVLKKELKKCLDILENYYHVKPVIYTNVDFYKKKLGEKFDEYPLWVAHYFQYREPRISRSWDFWQHSEEGRVNGINSKVDFNVFNGDSAAFRKLLIQ